MDEYISREAVIQYLKGYSEKELNSRGNFGMITSSVLDKAERAISEMPSADVEPQESEWQIVALRTIYDDIPYGHSYVCKNCGHTENRSNKYCGGCGYKMIGVDYG